MIKRILFAFLAAAVVAGCAARPTTSPASPATSVQTAPARQTDIRQALTYTGDVKAQSEINVVPKQSGRIEAMSVDVGSKVQAGDVVARIEHTTLDLNLQQARAQLWSAQARLDTVTAGPRPENVRQAELAVDTAQSRLQTLLDGPRAASVAQARLQVDQAQQRLDTIKAGGRAETVAQAQTNLTAAQARLTALKNGLRSEDVATLQLAVDQAKNALFGAQVSRDGACNPSNPQYLCKAASAQVDAAQSAVDQAHANLRAKTASPLPTDLQQAQAAVDQAQAAVALAQKPYTVQDLKTAQAALDQAEEGLVLASQPYTDQDVRQARDGVATAQQQLALARQPYTAQDLETAEAGVAQAQAAVDQAQQAVSDATITAPVAGVITAKVLDVGAMASPGQTVVTIAAGGIKVSIPVEETQVANLKIGQDASIAGAALGDQVIPAKITSIAPSGDPRNRTFGVDLTPQPSASGLLPGMFVQVTLNAVEHSGVVAVPTPAIVERAGRFYVYAVEDNVAHLVPVTVGLADGKLTEVTGVATGAVVVVQGQDQLADGDRVAATASP